MIHVERRTDAPQRSVQSPRRIAVAVLHMEEIRMLVLSRKKDGRIMINDDICIVVVEIRGDKVRLGIEAPDDVTVHRREVYDQIKREEAGGES
jgi:carbon storage regulator